MVTSLYEFKMERAPFIGTSLLKNSGHPSNLMEPFFCGSGYDGMWWLINGMPMTICCWCVGIWLLSEADIVMQTPGQIALAGKRCSDWSKSLKATRALSPPFLPPSHSRAPPSLPVFPPSLFSSTVPVIWSSRDGSWRFIKVDKWTQELGIMADPSDYGNSHEHVCPLAKQLWSWHLVLLVCHKSHIFQQEGGKYSVSGFAQSV